MKKEEIGLKLNKVLTRFGINTTYHASVISGFRQKLEFLFDSNRYNGLLKRLFSSNDRSEFNSYVFESLFAYDFESKGHRLTYEVKQLSSGNSSIDFRYSVDE